ncbi:MAG: cytochrome c-type biogenesis CcmF C-terminal domain-containing protein [Solirubrobacterales bacterium]
MVASRARELRSDHRLDSLFSREAVFLLNNLVLVLLCVVIWWGTFFPLISEALTGRRHSFGPPTVEAPKAWIDSRIPERTRNVPSRASENVPQIRVTFQTLSIPRRSWTMIECR